MRRLRLISHVTDSKHVFFHFVVYHFLKIFFVQLKQVSSNGECHPFPLRFVELLAFILTVHEM